MKQAFNTYQMASWLLGEALDPNDPMNEDDELDLEDTESEEKDEEEDKDEEESDDAEEAEDADADLDDLDLDNADEDAAEGEEDAENLNNNELLSRIDQKLDQLIDKQPDADEEFDLDISNPVCPCCGARLNIIDNTADTEDLATGEDANNTDFDIDALLDGEGPEGEEEEIGDDSDLEVNGEPIEAMDDDFDITPDNGEDGYVSLEDEDEDEEN
jgi:hypothetical protein